MRRIAKRPLVESKQPRKKVQNDVPSSDALPRIPPPLPPPPPDAIPQPLPNEHFEKPTVNESDDKLKELPTHVAFTTSVDILGQRKTLTSLVDYLKGEDTKPIVLNGPVACGKTYGVRAAIQASGFQVMELSGVDSEDGIRLLQEIERVRRLLPFKGSARIDFHKRIDTVDKDTNTETTEFQVHSFTKQVSRTVVFLDDFESFTPDLRLKIIKVLDRTSVRGNAPAVITCNQVRHPDMQVLSKYKSIRMNLPSRAACRAFLLKEHSTVLVNSVMGDLPTSRDVREMRNEILIRSVKRISNSKKQVSRPSSNFEATRRLLKRECDPQEWTTFTEWRDVDLLREHIPNYVGDYNISPIETGSRLSTFMHNLSDVDSMLPSRFECISQQDHLTRYVVGLTTRITSRARDVGALPPPRLPQASWGLPPEQSPGERPMTLELWRDARSLHLDPS